MNAGPLEPEERQTLRAAVLLLSGVKPDVGERVAAFEDRIRAQSDDPERDEWERRQRG